MKIIVQYINIYTSLDPAMPGAMCNKVLKILLKNKIKDK